MRVDSLYKWSIGKIRKITNYSYLDNKCNLINSIIYLQVDQSQNIFIDLQDIQDVNENEDEKCKSIKMFSVPFISYLCIIDKCMEMINLHYVDNKLFKILLYLKYVL